MLLDTRCYVKSATATETANTGDYQLNTLVGDTVLAVVAWQWSATSGSTSHPIRVSPDELLRLRATSNSLSSADPASAYALAGANLLMVYPTPTGADTITVYYVPKPTEMSSAAHDPATATYGGIPVEYHDAIEYQALARLASYDDDQSSAQGERYRQLYDTEIKRVRKEMYRLGGTPGPVIVNRRRRRFRPHDNSQDIR